MLGERSHIGDDDTYMFFYSMIQLEDLVSSYICYLTVPIYGTLLLPFIHIRVVLYGLGLVIQCFKFLDMEQEL